MKTEDGRQETVVRRRSPYKKPKGKLSSLPSTVRTEINRKLREGWRLGTIREWLFGQKAEVDIPDLGLKTGDSFSLAWTRDAKSEWIARHCCEQAISYWVRTHHRTWLEEEEHREESMRLLERAEELGAAANEKGQAGAGAGLNTLVRSQLFDVIDNVRSGSKDPAEIARLTNAWARMSQACTEVERFKLQSQKALDLGLHALRDEIKANPEALELFHKLRDVVKRSEDRSGSK